MSEVGGRGPARDEVGPSEGDLPPAWSPEELARQAVDRLPPRLRRPITRLLEGWPGRIALNSAESCVRIEIFDRSMTIAAQFFTSVFPILILFASWVGQGVTQWHTYTDEQHAHGETTEVGDFLAEFGQATLENWQSEFLQLFTFVALDEKNRPRAVDQAA